MYTQADIMRTKQVKGKVQLEEGIPRSFGTLLGSGKSKGALIAGVVCAGLVFIILIVAAVLIFKFNVGKSMLMSVGSRSRAGTDTEDHTVKK